MVHRTCATRTLWAYFYCGLLRRTLIQRSRSRLSSGFRIRGLHRSKYRLGVICLTLSLMMSRHPSAISVLDGASVGFVELCGSADHEGGMLVLKPGEWIRARANVKLHKWPSKATSARFRGVFWLRKNTFHPHPGSSSTESQNLYPNETPTPPIPFTCIPFAPNIRPTRRARICTILIHQNDNFAELFARFEVLVCQAAFG